MLHQFAEHLTRFGWIAAGVALLLTILIFLQKRDTTWIVPSLAIIALLSAIASVVHTRPTRLRSLAQLDEQEQTHELFGTAWSIRHRTSEPWAHHLLALAEQAATARYVLKFSHRARTLPAAMITLLLIAMASRLFAPSVVPDRDARDRLVAVEIPPRATSPRASSVEPSNVNLGSREVSSATPIPADAARNAATNTGTKPAPGTERSHDTSPIIAPITPPDGPRNGPSVATARNPNSRGNQLASANGAAADTVPSAFPNAAAGQVQSDPALTPWTQSHWTTAQNNALSEADREADLDERDLIRAYFSK